MAFGRGRVIVTGAAVVAALSMGISAVQAAPSPGWRIVKDIAVANTGLDDIVATSPGVAWAAGSSSTPTPVVYRWQRRRWRAIARPGPTGSFAESVAASSASNVWVALANDPAVDHWNGHRWTRKSFAAVQQVLIDGVATTGPHNAWVFTLNFGTKQETAHHYNGRTWKAEPLPIEVDSATAAGAVSASSASNIWAWGYNMATKTDATLHYNGKSWRVIPVPAHLAPAKVSIQSDRILAESNTDVWATVSAFSSSGPVVLLHWNGHRWRKVTGKLPTGSLTGPIASDGHGGLWLVNDRLTKSDTVVYYLAHYRAGKWTRSSVPTAPGGAVDITALALIPGTRSLWGTGDIGVSFSGDAGAAILKYGD